MVKLKVPSNPGFHVWVHKGLLTRRPYLAEYFKKNARTEGDGLILPMLRCSHTMAPELVYWLYTGQLSSTFSVDEVKLGYFVYCQSLQDKLVDLYCTAKRYKLEDLAAVVFGKIEMILQVKRTSWFDLRNLRRLNLPKDENGNLMGLMIASMADDIRGTGWDAYTATQTGFSAWLETNLDSRFVMELMRRLTDSQVPRKAEVA